MMGLLNWRETPLSVPRLVAYLAALLALVWLSLQTEASQAVAPPGGGPLREPLRLGRPMAELYPRLRQLGLPWYLRRAGAKADITGDGAAELVLDVNIAGHRIGRYVEHMERLDDDRTKVWLSFDAADPEAVAALAGPVKSRLADADLLRAILKEHIRSELADDGFDLSVLENRHMPLIEMGSRWLRAMHVCPAPQTDDFPLCERDLEAATVRHAHMKAVLR